MDAARIATAALDAAVDFVGVDASMIVLSQPDGSTFAAARGLAPEEEQGLRKLLTGLSLSEPRPADVARLQSEGGVRRFESGYLVPLASKETMGVLAVFWHRLPSLAALHADVLGELALAAAVALANERVFGETREAAARDPLTGLYNRRIFHEELAREIEAAQRYPTPLTLLVFDVDDFKRVNTELGHLEGDRILSVVGDVLLHCSRAADIPGRVGGDEFAVVLPHSTVDDAARLYTRLVSGVRTATAAVPLPILLSAGSADLRPGEGGDGLFGRADEALRLAKSSGKHHHRVFGRGPAADGGLGEAHASEQQV
jgi:diguanylate cyclase (GGDEF)-like protein